MAGERSYVRVPPDSTGKKIRHNPYHRVSFNNRVGNHIWKLGEEYTISGSVNITVLLATGDNLDSGQVELIFESGDEYLSENLTAGDFIQYEGSTVATVVDDELIHVPHVNLAGGRSNNTVDVDGFGAMNIRFSDGRPQTDAFGRLRISQGTTLGDYVFAYNTLPADFSTLIYGNASVTHDADLRALKLICPAGTPASGAIPAPAPFTGKDLVAHTTNTYHHYFPGFSQEAIMTVALGDTGKAGVTRNWGTFDFDNGYGFRCDNETDGLKVFIRSSATGSKTEIIINQADFNGDTIDGTGRSGMNLRLTDDNIYWVDVQWLGGGRVRFGTYYRGERVVMHEYYHEGDNNNGKPHAQTGSLPICFSQLNSQTQLAETTMAAWCCAVHTEHDVDFNTVGRSGLETITKTFDPTSLENGQAYEFLGALAPVQTIAPGSGGSSNRTLYLPSYLEALAYDSNGNDVLMEVEIYVDPVIGGGKKSFNINQDQITDADTAFLTPVENSPLNTVESFRSEDYALIDRPKYWGGGFHNYATYLRGKDKFDLTNKFNNLQYGAFKNYAEDGGIKICQIASITPGAVTSLQVEHAYHIHREGEPIKFQGIVGTVGTDGTSGLNYDGGRDNEYYLKITGSNTAELYEDIEFNTAVNTSTLAYTSGGEMQGLYGTQLVFAIVAKPLAPTIAAALDVTVHFNLGWKEINQ